MHRTQKRTTPFFSILPPLNSVRIQLAIWNIVILALMLASIGFLLRRMVHDSLYEGLEQGLKSRSKFAAARWASPRNASDPSRVAEIQHRKRMKPNSNARLPFPQILSLSGHNYLPGPDAPMDTVAFRRAIQGETRTTIQWQDMSPVSGKETPQKERVMVLTMPLRNKSGQINAVFQEGESLARADEQVAKTTAILLRLIPTAILIAGVGGLLLTERAIRPVRAITRAAGEIEAKDLSGRLAVVGKDEFAELAATFNAMLGRLERSFEQQKRFVADASHELRTPITIIKANTTLALSSPRSPDDYRETLREINWAAERTNRIVQDLFLLARSDNGELPVQREVLLLDELLRRCAQTMCNATDTPHAPVTYITNSTINGTNTRSKTYSVPLYVLADGHYLERLFTNLIENALRHTSPEDKVMLSATVENGKVVARVTDTGEGIAPEHLEHLCERFYRVDTDRSRGKGGTGLGLSICDVIATVHDGNLKIESEVGVGTTVTVTLPHIQIEEEEKFSDFLVII